MKILQLNIWGGRLHKNIAKLIARESPDVVCLQEVISVPPTRGGFFTTLEDINAQLSYEHVHYSPTLSFTYLNRTGYFGNVILSRYPFESIQTLFTNGTYIEQFDPLEVTAKITNLQHVSIPYQGFLLHVLNHHGYHVPEHKNGNEETVRQCTEISEYIKTLEGPVVLTGDFNLAPESESLELINAVLINHAKERRVATTRTPLTHKTEVCDYIFTSEDLTVTEFQVLDDVVSDHKALTIIAFD